MKNILNFVLSRQIVGRKNKNNWNNKEDYQVIKIKKSVDHVDLKSRSFVGNVPISKLPIIQTLPPLLLERVNKDSNGMMRIITELEIYISYADLVHQDRTSEVLSTLKNLSRILYDATSALHTGNRSPTKTNHVAGYFVQFGGINYLKEILLRLPILFEEKYNNRMSKNDATYNDKNRSKERKLVYKVMNETGSTLRELMFTFNHLGDLNKLGSNHFILHIFEYLLKGDTFDMAVGLLEEIFSIRDEMFCLADVPKFYQRILTFSQRQLCVLCRLFALLIFADMSNVKEKEEEVDEQVVDVYNNNNNNSNNNNNEMNTKSPSQSKTNNVDTIITNNSPTNFINDLNDNMNVGLSISSSSTLPNSNSNSPLPNINDANNNNDINNNNNNNALSSSVMTPTSTTSSSSSPLSSSSQKKKKKKSNKIQLLKDKGMRKRRTLKTIDRNHAFLVGNEEILDRFMLLIYKSVKSLPTARRYKGELGTFNNLIPSRAMLQVLSLTDDKSEEEEWYSDMGQFEKIFYDNEDNVYTDLYNTYLATNVGNMPKKSMMEKLSLHQIFEVLRDAIGTSGMDSQHTNGNSSSNNNDNNDTIFNSKITMRDVIITTFLVEILFVLAILCHGKRKIDLQQYFERRKLGTLLNMLFDVLDWTPEPRQTHGPHGPGCQCNVASAVKVQFLRLAHNFMEREDTQINNRMQLLSKKQLSIRFEITNKIMEGTRNGMFEAFNYACAEFERLSVHQSTITPEEKEKMIFDQDIEGQTQKNGLLSKIIKLMTYQTEESYSAYRFWFASTIESFLRGSEPEDQIIVASHKKFLPNLVKDLLNLVGNDCNGMQTNFDLLGEMIKFNSVILEYLDSLLTPAEFRQLFDVISTHLIDSNVFIRSLMLTLEFEVLGFHNNDLRGNNNNEVYLYADVDADDPKYDTRFHMNKHYTSINTAEGKETPESSLYVGKTKFHHHLQTNRQQIICDICTAIDVTKISQENLCCLNTTIILLIFSNIHGTLVEDVEYLKRKEKNWQNPGSIVISFRRLLWFWDRYYHRRAHDRLSLEMSSRLPFHMFDEVVEILVKDDGSEGSLCMDSGWMREWDYLNPLFRDTTG